MSSESTNLIDLDLVDKVVDLIPDHTWDLVTTYLVDQLVDNMPSSVLEALTDDPVGFDKAEQILTGYYQDASHHELITDVFNVLGPENTLYMLDSWQLDKIPNKSGISETAPSNVSEL